MVVRRVRVSTSPARVRAGNQSRSPFDARDAVCDGRDRRSVPILRLAYRSDHRVYIEGLRKRSEPIPQRPGVRSVDRSDTTSRQHRRSRATRWHHHDGAKGSVLRTSAGSDVLVLSQAEKFQRTFPSVTTHDHNRKAQGHLLDVGEQDCMCALGTSSER